MHFRRFALFGGMVVALLAVLAVQRGLAAGRAWRERDTQHLVEWEAAAEREQALAEALEELAARLEELEAQVEAVREETLFEPWELPLGVELQRYTWARCRAAGVPVELVFAVMEHESGFRTDALGLNRNGTVDVGLMQINSVNWPWLKELGIDVHRPQGNIDAGVLLLRRLRQKGYATGEVLAAYAAGERGMLRGEGRWFVAEIAEILEGNREPAAHLDSGLRPEPRQRP